MSINIQSLQKTLATKGIEISDANAETLLNDKTIIITVNPHIHYPNTFAIIDLGDNTLTIKMGHAVAEKPKKTKQPKQPKKPKSSSK
jgi:hypothetical protein